MQTITLLIVTLIVSGVRRWGSRCTAAGPQAVVRGRRRSGRQALYTVGEYPHLLPRSVRTVQSLTSRRWRRVLSGPATPPAAAAGCRHPPPGGCPRLDIRSPALRVATCFTVIRTTTPPSSAAITTDRPSYYISDPSRSATRCRAEITIARRCRPVDQRRGLRLDDGTGGCILTVAPRRRALPDPITPTRRERCQDAT
jgi:hypothetical protein